MNHISVISVDNNNYIRFQSWKCDIRPFNTNCFNRSWFILFITDIIFFIIRSIFILKIMLFFLLNNLNNFLSLSFIFKTNIIQTKPSISSWSNANITARILLIKNDTQIKNLNNIRFNISNERTIEIIIFWIKNIKSSIIFMGG